LVATTQQQQPGISDGQLINMMNAAMCPAVAGMSDLSTAAKRTKLLHLDTLVQQQIAAAAPPPAASHVVLSVPLAPNVAASVANAAAANHQTPDAYLADLIAKQTAGKK
jgi:hypothetical protein